MLALYAEDNPSIEPTKARSKGRVCMQNAKKSRLAASAPVVILIAGMSLAACTRPSSARETIAATPSNSTGLVREGAGIACSYNGATGPPSYPIHDIGKAGVPAVSSVDKRTLWLLMRYVHPSTLRFAYLQGRFSVFDAIGGPCSATPYSILNATNCNAIYVPFDGTGLIGAATDCNMKPRPWIPNDIGNPYGHSWTDYPNSH